MRGRRRSSEAAVLAAAMPARGSRWGWCCRNGRAPPALPAAQALRARALLTASGAARLLVQGAGRRGDCFQGLVSLAISVAEGKRER